MKITFICSGNVFRSVFAEGYFKKLVSSYAKEDVVINSCGTIAEPYFKIPKVLKKVFLLYKIDKKDIKNHVPTRISEEIICQSDIIFVMDRGHINFIQDKFKKYSSKTFLLKEYAGFFSQPEIYDPIGQSDIVYIQTAEEIKICLEIIIKKLFQKGDITNVTT